MDIIRSWTQSTSYTGKAQIQTVLSPKFKKIDFSTWQARGVLVAIGILFAVIIFRGIFKKTTSITKKPSGNPLKNRINSTPPQNKPTSPNTELKTSIDEVKQFLEICNKGEIKTGLKQFQNEKLYDFIFYAAGLINYVTPQQLSSVIQYFQTKEYDTKLLSCIKSSKEPEKIIELLSDDTIKRLLHREPLYVKQELLHYFPHYSDIYAQIEHFPLSESILTPTMKDEEVETTLKEISYPIATRELTIH